MQPLQQRFVTAILVVTTCFGCTDKDREMARRTSDGSDTFKYVPPQAPAASSPKGPRPSDVDSKDFTKTKVATDGPEKGVPPTEAVKSAASTSTTSATAKSKSPSTSASFQYRPDPRLLKQLSHPDGK